MVSSDWIAEWSRWCCKSSWATQKCTNGIAKLSKSVTRPKNRCRRVNEPCYHISNNILWVFAHLVGEIFIFCRKYCWKCHFHPRWVKLHFNFAYGVTISLHPLCGWKKVGEKRWVKTGGWKCVGKNVWVKIAGWKRTGGFEGVNCFDNICSFPRIIHRNVAILNWFKWFYWTAPKKSLSWWLSYRSPSELIYDTFLHICIRVRVCVRERERVCV